MIPSSSSFFDTFEILVRFNYRDQITCLGLGSRFCLSVGAVKKTSQTIFVRKSLWQISLKFVYAFWYWLEACVLLLSIPCFNTSLFVKYKVSWKLSANCPTTRKCPCSPQPLLCEWTYNFFTLHLRLRSFDLVYLWCVWYRTPVDWDLI